MQTQKRVFSMRAIGRASTLSLGLAMLATLFTSNAIAGCGSYDPTTRSLFPQSLAQTDQTDTQSADEHPSGSRSIVGMWKISFEATDGSGFRDFGYTQWHGDGTEFLNSGSRAPATQNYCLGVWEQTGQRTYSLNHFALSYNAATGDLDGKVRIVENVWLAPGGDRFAGTFLIQVFDPSGKMVVAHFQGNVSAKRITIRTTMP